MNVCKRIISFFIAFAMVICFCSISVFAEGEYSSSLTSLYDILLMGTTGPGALTELITGNSATNEVLGQKAAELSSNLCSASGDHYHHGTLLTGENGYDAFGRYYMLTCSQCGNPFKCYSSDLAAAYNNYAEGLPASGYSSNNTLIWRPEMSVVWESTSWTPTYQGTLTGNPVTWSAQATSSLDSGKLSHFRIYLTIPVTGNYMRWEKFCDGQSSLTIPGAYRENYVGNKSAGDVIYLKSGNESRIYDSYPVYYYRDVYFVVTPSASVTDTYPATSRINQNVDL